MRFRGRRSKGVTIAGLYFLAASAAGFLISLYFLFKMPQQALKIYSEVFRPDPKILAKCFYIFLLLSHAVTFVMGINILRLKEKWRKFTLYYCVFMIFCIQAFFLLAKEPVKAFLSGGLFPAAFFGVIFYFFTRRSVKEQFRLERIKKSGAMV